MQRKLYELIINEELDNELEVSCVSGVDRPAIERGFLAFVEPVTGERKTDFLPRCISYVINEGKDNEQAIAICNSLWEQHFAADKVSYDYDDTLSTEHGKQMATNDIKNGATVYIISARQDKEGMLTTAKDLGIPESRVYATGSNKAKVDKIKELGITKHHDNNIDVINQLGNIGAKFLSLQFVEVNEDERILVGPAMIPNTPIRRIDEATGQEYDVFFSKDTIEKIAVKFFAKGFQNNFNLMHDPNLKMEGVVFFQSFIKDSNKGIEGMTGDYIDGTWFLGAKVYNDEVWAKVKSGEIKGWSVEGIFGYKAMPMPIEQQQYDAILKIISELN